MQTLLSLRSIAECYGPGDEPDYEFIRIVADNHEDRDDLLTAEALRWLADNEKWPMLLIEDTYLNATGIVWAIGLSLLRQA